MNSASPTAYLWRGDVGDEEVEALHAASFESQPSDRQWSRQLHGFSLGWLTARQQDRLVGFVNVAWDGGDHAFLVDTCVAQDVRCQGIGEQLVRRAIDGARVAGCRWIHVDFEARFQHFYVARCGFHSSQAGVMRL